jgi:hypothetical protein
MCECTAVGAEQLVEGDKDSRWVWCAGGELGVMLAREQLLMALAVTLHVPAGAGLQRGGLDGAGCHTTCTSQRTAAAGLRHCLHQAAGHGTHPAGPQSP